MSNGYDDEQQRYLRTAFLERVAHELRGPAGVIQGALQELELALGSEAAAHRGLFDMAKRGVQRVVRTADRLQQTGQCERGPLPLSAASCDVSTLLRKAVADAEALEGRKKISVRLELPPEPLLCSVDGRWLAVALYEIASNAIRHARAQVEVRASLHGEQLQVAFRNDSNGNTGNNAFGPLRFVQPREARGLGLALAIVRDIVAAHGGTLEIETQQFGAGVPGTEVRVVMPRAQSARDALEGAR